MNLIHYKTEIEVGCTYLVSTGCIKKFLRCAPRKTTHVFQFLLISDWILRWTYLVDLVFFPLCKVKFLSWLISYIEKCYILRTLADCFEYLLMLCFFSIKNLNETVPHNVLILMPPFIQILLFFAFFLFFYLPTLLGTYFISYYYITCTTPKLAFTYVRIITHKYCFPRKFTTDIENTQFAFCLLGRGEREGDKPLFSLVW